MSIDAQRYRFSREAREITRETLGIARDEFVYLHVGAFNEQLTAAGQWVFGGGLEAPNTATVIRPSQGATTLFDGPYAESKEQMGGFWVIEVPDLDTALELGRQAAAACEGPVEVRPFQNG